MEKGGAENYAQPDLREEDELLYGGAALAKAGVNAMPRVEGKFDNVQGGEFTDNQLEKAPIFGMARLSVLGAALRDSRGRFVGPAYPGYYERTDSTFDLAYERMSAARHAKTGFLTRAAVELATARKELASADISTESPAESAA